MWWLKKYAHWGIPTGEWVVMFVASMVASFSIRNIMVFWLRAAPAGPFWTSILNPLYVTANGIGASFSLVEAVYAVLGSM